MQEGKLNQELNDEDDQIEGTPESTPQVDVDALIAEGELASRSGDHEQALEAFNKAIALDPANAMAWFNRGVLLEAKQDPRGAKQSFTICLDLKPDHGPALANLAILLERVGDDTGAHNAAEKALVYFPGHPTLTDLFNRTKNIKNEEVDLAPVMPDVETKWKEEDLESAMKATGVTDRQAILQEATHHDADGNAVLDSQELEMAATMVKARMQAESVIETNIDHEEPTPSETTEMEELVLPEIEIPEEQPSVNLEEICIEAEGLLKSAKPTESLKLLKPYLHNEASKHAKSWRIAAASMAGLDLDDHAINAFTHALSIEPDAKAFFNLGMIQHRQGDLSSAQKSFHSALATDDNYLNAAKKLTVIAQENEDVESYLTGLRAISRISGDDVDRIALATALIEIAEGESVILENMSSLPPTIPQGPELAEEARTLLEGKSGAILARALSLCGMHTESVVQWKQLIESDKQNPAHWLGLSKSLEAAGDRERAEKCRAKAQMLSTGPQPENTTQANIPSEGGSPTLSGAPQITSPQMMTVGQATAPQEQPLQPPPPPPGYEQAPTQTSNLLTAHDALAQQPPIESQSPAPTNNPTVDLARAALEVTATTTANQFGNADSSAIANMDVDWYNKGLALIQDNKYREALSCFDRALASFSGNDEMVIRILNGRGNAFYYLEEYPKCIESYHQAMVINPTSVRGQTLYNMGTAYAEMERFQDAIKCFEQATPRGLSKEESKLAKEQIRRCKLLVKEQQKRQ